MDLQDKIGREMAKDFLKEYAGVHEWDPKKVDLFKNTDTYRFYVNKPRSQYDTKTHTFKITKWKRTMLSAERILPFELNLLLKSKTINESQYDILKFMVTNEGDYELGIMSINMFRNKRIKNGSRKLKE